MPGHLSDNFPNATAQFWNGQSLTWVVLARIDETTYCLLGCPGGRPGTEQAKQKSINFTSTHTYVDLDAGFTSITLDFFSPVDPYDHVRQSLPYSYLTVSAKTDDTYQPDVDVLTAIDASWLNDRGAPYAEYSAVNGSKILKLNGEQGREFSERGQMALWGDVVLATKDEAASTLTSCQLGSVSSFLLTGSLVDGLEMSGEESVAACARTLKSDDTQAAATFAIGLQQEDQIQYFDGSKLERWTGYFRSKVSTVEEAVEYFFSDFNDASAQSKEFDQRVIDLGKKTSSNYSDLLEFSVRQS